MFAAVGSGHSGDGPASRAPVARAAKACRHARLRGRARWPGIQAMPDGLSSHAPAGSIRDTTCPGWDRTGTGALRKAERLDPVLTPEQDGPGRERRPRGPRSPRGRSRVLAEFGFGGEPVSTRTPFTRPFLARYRRAYNTLIDVDVAYARLRRNRRQLRAIRRAPGDDLPRRDAASPALPGRTQRRLRRAPLHAEWRTSTATTWSWSRTRVTASRRWRTAGAAGRADATAGEAPPARRRPEGHPPVGRRERRGGGRVRDAPEPTPPRRSRV
jgi:hypothetical protein